MSIRVSTYITDPDESTLSPSQLSITVSTLPGISGFVKDKPKNTFRELLGTKSHKKTKQKSDQSLIQEVRKGLILLKIL